MSIVNLKSGKKTVYIYILGSKHRVGTFDTEAEAVAADNAAEEVTTIIMARFNLTNKVKARKAA